MAALHVPAGDVPQLETIWADVVVPIFAEMTDLVIYAK